MQFNPLKNGWRVAGQSLQRRLNAAATALSALFLVGSLAAVPATSKADPISGMGAWETVLRARDINGNALASLLDPNAAFFYDSSSNLTWLANFTLGSTVFGPGIVRPRLSQNTYGLPAPGPDGYLAVRDLVIGGVGGWREPAQYQPWFGCSNPGARYINVETRTSYTCDEAAGLLREYDHLIYTLLGNTPGSSPGADVLVNTGPFRNMVVAGGGFASDPACESTVCRIFPSSLQPEGIPFGNTFEFSDRVSLYNIVAGGGFLLGNDDGGLMATTVVRVGDVLRGSNSVPEPSPLALMLAVLATAVLRRQNRSNGRVLPRQ